MARTAILEYFTSPGNTLLFVVKPGWETPAVVALQRSDGRPLGSTELTACGDRLLADFHGLPADWSRSPRAAR